MSVRGEVRRRRRTPYSHVLRATDATSLCAQAQTSTTKTKERPALLLDPGIPMADDMTISSWVHFPLPSSPFQYNQEVDRGSPLKRRRHRWATLYYGTLGQVPGVGGESGDEFNHVCILHFEDNMDYKHVTGGQGTKTGAQFGITCSDKTVVGFEAFEAGDGEPQRHISGLSDGWHLVTLVLVTSPHQDRLFVDGKVRAVLPPLASTPPTPPSTPPALLHSLGARRAAA